MRFICSYTKLKLLADAMDHIGGFAMDNFITANLEKTINL